MEVLQCIFIADFRSNIVREHMLYDLSPQKFETCFLTVCDWPPSPYMLEERMYPAVVEYSMLFIRLFLFFNYFLLFFLFLFLLYFALQYCIGFAIHWHESATSVHEFPNMNPPPTFHPISSLWIIHKSIVLEWNPIWYLSADSNFTSWVAMGKLLQVFKA